MDETGNPLVIVPNSQECEKTEGSGVYQILRTTDFASMAFGNINVLETSMGSIDTTQQFMNEGRCE